MIGYIYQIKNLITGQSYIGQTIDIKRRKNTHFSTLRNNKHENPKLQASWNKYGEKNFSFTFWEFQINNLEELDQLECDFINKFNALADGFNLISGGRKPPLHKKVQDDDVVTFLCVFEILGDGYGKTCEQIFGWSKGTASAIKRRVRYADGWLIYESLSPEERRIRGENFIESQHLKEQALKRQLTQGGCLKAYLLTQEDYNFAFAAQELGYSYTSVANYLQIKPATVKDWFNGRSRKKEKEKFNNLSEQEKNLLFSRVKTAELSGNPKSISSI